MDNQYQNLYNEGLLSDASFEKLKQKPPVPLFSVYWEIKTLLYLGVLLLTSGLGLLIYENIDTIGHQFVLLLIALISGGCFVYCFKNKLPFNKQKVQAPNAYFDYILLLATISLVIFVGYLQYQYSVFGTHYGMATFFPMLALFFIAYYFDHIGILSMAIVNLALWMGISVTPKELLLHTDWDNETIIYTALLLSALLIAAGWLTHRVQFKGHFNFSYWHYGVHVAFITLLAGYFHYYDALVAILWMLGVLAFGIFVYNDAIKGKSFYFLLLVVLYGYVALSSLMVRMFLGIHDQGGIYLILLYFICSGLGLVLLLINLNKKLKAE